jgi:hypothetical protein
MSLLIAGILIYHFDMDWWWYPLAVGIWAGHMAMRYRWLDGRAKDLKRP